MSAPHVVPAPTVLVVDDAEALRTLTARMLAQGGHRVMMAGDGVEAVELLERESIALVLTDLRMPRMDGHQLASLVASRWPTVRMMFMTGHSEAELTAGLPGPVIMKPFDLDALMLAVEQALNGATH